jgi:hypothetical protein
MNTFRGTLESVSPKSVLDSLAQPGGRILVLMLLVMTGCVASQFQVPSADHISLSALSVLLYQLGGSVRS